MYLSKGVGLHKEFFFFTYGVHEHLHTGCSSTLIICHCMNIECFTLDTNTAWTCFVTYSGQFMFFLVNGHYIDYMDGFVFFLSGIGSFFFTVGVNTYSLFICWVY